MAAKKKFDGGAARAQGRKKVHNKRQEARYGMQGFTAQANRNLQQPVLGRPQDTAIAGIGVSSAGVGRLAGRAIARTGVPARIANVVTRQKVIVHGTPNRIQGNFIRPAAGSPGSPNEAVVFGWNPRHKGSKQFVPSSAREYTQGTGSAVVAKVPKSSLKSIHAEKGNVGAKQTPWVVSKSPARVVSQVPANSKNYESELAKALKRAGAPLRGPKKTPIKDMRQRAKTRSANKRSVV